MRVRIEKPFGIVKNIDQILQVAQKVKKIKIVDKKTFSGSERYVTNDDIREFARRVRDFSGE